MASREGVGKGSSESRGRAHEALQSDWGKSPDTPEATVRPGDGRQCCSEARLGWQRLRGVLCCLPSQDRHQKAPPPELT